MVYIEEVAQTLLQFGTLLKQLRIARGDTQDVFAQRLGVSRPTLRAMERGEPTVQMGHWLNAWWVLNQLGTLREAFDGSISLFDRMPRKTPRSRASPRSRAR